MSVGKGIKNFILMGLAGVGTGIVLMIILVLLVRVVVADEVVAIREARLGEQDRSLNYRPAPVHIVYGITDAMRYENEVESLTSFQCGETNLYLLAMVENIAHNIALYPDLGHIYEDTLLIIREAWCEQ